MNAGRPLSLAEVLRACSPSDRRLLARELRKPHGMWRDEIEAELRSAVRVELSRIECEELDRSDLAESADEAAVLIARAAGGAA